MTEYDQDFTEEYDCANCEAYGFPCLNCAEYIYQGQLGAGHTDGGERVIPEDTPDDIRDAMEQRQLIGWD